MTATTLILCIAALTTFLVVSFLVVRIVREENRRQRAFIERLRAIGRRCPDCRGMCFHLGAMKPNGGYETFTCPTCNGTGECEG